MIEIDQARGLLARAVLTQGPDFIYNPDGLYACAYAPQPDVDEGNPRRITGCLVGVALDLAGETRHHRINGGIAAVRDSLPGLLSEDAEAYFRVAQVEQDRGASWGRAYAEAEATLDEADEDEADEDADA
jgi:hypothetical protein